ncbi:Bowman-Birk type trypsin inhibitor [Triticum urartu]|uniref:Bowman-Birk type trypsin inhibitor n=1 Tax=Triticum urartu TaxID=4572 RepID=M7XKV1_TRIUA|nr:Bowman-Birk type trypsin inhibitor [Triticum urartu]
MKRTIAAVLLVLSLGALVAAIADDHVDTIRLPSNGLADEVATAATEKKRPWKCCDSPLCSRSIPPRCRCMDAVEQCDEACTRCEASQSDPSKRMCNDRYHGWPGPNCTEPDADDIPSGTGPGVSGPPVVGQEATAAMATETAVSEESAALGEEKPRPWKCCDHPLCTRSSPPTCFCHDKVKKCAKTCKNCLKDESGSSLRVCGDRYFGWAGPRCHEI